MTRLDPQMVRRYWRRLEIKSTSLRILDLGCGTGSMAELRPAPGIEVVGLDFDPQVLAEASKHCIETHACDLSVENIPLPDASVDGVIAKDIVEHVPHPLKLMKDIRRVMKPGARLVLSVPMEFGRVVWGDYTHYRGFTERALRQLVADAGFELFEVEPMGGVPLAGRLGFVEHIPKLLRIPGLRHAFGSSWEAVMGKPKTNNP